MTEQLITRARIGDRRTRIVRVNRGKIPQGLEFVFVARPIYVPVTEELSAGGRWLPLSMDFTKAVEAPRGLRRCLQWLRRLLVYRTTAPRIPEARVVER
jgi:hypothetical protein